MISNKLILSALMFAGALLPQLSHAQQYPTKTIRFVIPSAPGQTLDNLARFYSDRMSKALGVGVIVENKPGAGTLLGTEFVARAPADGYTLLMGSMPHFVNPHLSERPVNYDPFKSFVPVAMLAKTSLGIVVGEKSKYKSLPQLIDAMRQNPGEITYATGGSGTAAHLCASLLNDVTKTKAKHIPYSNTVNGITDVATGLIDFSCQGSGGVIGFIKSGKLKLLATTGDRRWKDAQDTPLTSEVGVGSLNIQGWLGVLAPANTPDAVVQKLSNTFLEIGRNADYTQFLELQQMEVDLRGHAEFSEEFPRIAERFGRFTQTLKAQNGK